MQVVKKLIIIAMFIFCMCCNSFAFSTNAYDYAGMYTLVLLDFQSQPVQTYEYDLQIEESGLYSLIEQQIIGEHSYEYPILTGIWKIHPDSQTITLNAGGMDIPFSYDNGLLIGNNDNLSGLGIVAYDKSKLCYMMMNTTCKYDITGDDEAQVGDIKSYYISTNSARCYYNINVSEGASINEIKYTDTGDAILTVEFNNEGLTSIQVGNTIFSVNVRENQQ